MIKLKNIITEDQIKKLSPQEVMDRKFFGPLYHGTSSTNRELIDKEGFKIFVGNERQGNISNGFKTSDYYGGIPAPIHLLGFGIYFTTVLSIAKSFNHNTTIGLKVYYIDASHKETINFGSPRTMMDWWLKNGYDYNKEFSYNTTKTMSVLTPDVRRQLNFNFEEMKRERLRATIHMTDYLKEKYDLVWYKGKSNRRLLDGDQVCVYNPNTIYEMDTKLAKTGEIGSKVVSVVNIDPYSRGEIKIPMGTKGIILNKELPVSWAKNEGANMMYDIQWKRGGRMYQVLDKWIQLL